MFPPRNLRVIVRDAEGKPLRDANVTLSIILGRTGTWGGKEVSNAAGQAAFKNIYAGGMYGINVDSTGYYSYRSAFPPPAVGTNAWKPTQEITLKKADMAKGRLIDEQGKALSGAEVTLVGWSSTSTTTDADGAFEVAVPPQDRLEYDERLAKPMVVFKVVDKGRDLGVFANIDRAELIKDGIVLTARPSRALTVVVKDADGKPLKGVEVNAFAWYGSHGDGGQILFTDADGRVPTTTVYFGGHYRVRTKLAGYYGPSEQIPDAVGGKGWSDRLELVMERADRTQKGTVVDEAAAPVVGATVKSTANDTSKTTSGVGGAFTLTGLPNSKVTIYASLGDLSGSAEVSKDSGDVVVKMKKRPTK